MTRLVLPEIITSDLIEALNEDSLRETRTLRLSTHGLRSSTPFADARLLGFFSRLQQQRVALSLRVDTTPREGTPLHRLLTDSLTGLLIGHYSSEFLGPRATNLLDSFTADQDTALSAHGGFFSFNNELSFPIVDRPGRPQVSTLILEDRVARFAADCAGVLYGQLELESLIDRKLEYLTEFLFEALQNTRDHGAVDLQGRGIEGIRYLSLRKLDRLAKTPVESSGSSVIDSYLRSLLRDGGRGGRARFLFEATVADGGIGIPARMANSLGIYEGPHESELAQFRAALSPSGTSKPSTIVGAGLGLDKMLQATQELGGVALFRTGRIRAHYSCFAPTPSWSFDEYPRIGGTSVSILFPWSDIVETRQRSLF